MATTKKKPAKKAAPKKAPAKKATKPKKGDKAQERLNKAWEHTL